MTDINLRLAKKSQLLIDQRAMSKSSLYDYQAGQYYSGLKQLGLPLAADKLNQKKLTDIQTVVSITLGHCLQAVRLLSTTQPF